MKQIFDKSTNLEKQQQTKETYQLIETMLPLMSDLLIVCDASGRIKQTNPALEKLTGKKASDFINQSLQQLFTPQSKFDFKSKSILKKVRNNEFKVSILSVDGPPVSLLLNCSSRYDENGNLTLMVLIGRPEGELRTANDDLNRTLNELKQTQQQLVHSEKMASLGRLVAGVAHELNNPISFVFGNMHALKKYGSRITEYMGAIDNCKDIDNLQKKRSELKIDRIIEDLDLLIEGTMEGAERVSNIVQDLKGYSGGQKEQASRFDLIDVIYTAVHWVVNASRIKAKVTYQIPDYLEYHGKKGQIHQILVNLVQNALDAMAQLDSPALQIKCRLEKNTIKIQVIDAGNGLDKESLNSLFEPFYTTKPVGQGTGLGLYISYGLAQDSGGSLEAENHTDGGAVFTLSLPVSSSEMLML